MHGFDPSSFGLLQSKAPAELFDRIDELRSLGFERRISLPQLVVCGDQNCGKTSVFEAITGVRLPINDGISTRFATEVAFRKSPEISTSVKIRPGPNAPHDHKRKLGIFARPHNWLQNIPKLFSEARLIMGLTHDDTYSQDVLQLEVTGPSLPDLTVVDLPGLLQAPGQNQTVEDVASVKQLVASYMNNPRNIILAVVSAETPLSQQSVLRMTGSCANRTMAIVTKLDALEFDAPGRGTFYARAKNQDTPLRLGWHLLRNADWKSYNSFRLNRDEIETLFFTRSSPWKTLPQNIVGIDALRERLSKVLLAQVEVQLSMLASDIQNDLELSRASLLKLNPGKLTNAERRRHLTGIGERVQSLARDAISGEYHDAYFRYNPKKPSRRLRSSIRNWAEDFASDMRQRGHSHYIYDITATDGEFTPPARASPNDPEPVSKPEFIESIAELIKQSKGRELFGMTNAQIVGELFVQYSLKWVSITRAHVFEAWKLVKRFLDDLLHDLAGEGIGEAILREVLNNEMEERLLKMNEKIDELISPYKRIIPTTLNRGLSPKILKLQKDSEGAEDGKRGNETHSSETDFILCSELLECMLAYYSVALDVFVDNVAGLAVENCLLDDLENVISPTRIAGMSNMEISRLAADSREVELAGIVLSRKIKVLEIAATACTRCEMAALESTAQNYRLSENDSDLNSRTLSDASWSTRSPSFDIERPYTPRSAAKGPKQTKQHSSHMLRAFPVPLTPLDTSTPRTANGSRTEPPSPAESPTASPRLPVRTPSVSTPSVSTDSGRRSSEPRDLPQVRRTKSRQQPSMFQEFWRM